MYDGPDEVCARLNLKAKCLEDISGWTRIPDASDRAIFQYQKQLLCHLTGVLPKSVYPFQRSEEAMNIESEYILTSAMVHFLTE